MGELRPVLFAALAFSDAFSFNRYMICKLGFEPGEAIRRFEQGRGHPFDHQEYVENLRSLEPAEDISMKQWHSIGGRIIGGVDDDEEESFDPDQLENLGRRSRQWRRKSPERFVFSGETSEVS